MFGGFMEKIGALWEKNGQFGTFYSGVIEVEGRKLEIIASIITEKTKETSPDLLIKLSKKKSEV